MRTWSKLTVMVGRWCGSNYRDRAVTPLEPPARAAVPFPTHSRREAAGCPQLTASVAFGRILNCIRARTTFLDMLRCITVGSF